MSYTMLFSHVIWCLEEKKRGYGWLVFEDYIRMVELEILETPICKYFHGINNTNPQQSKVLDQKIYWLQI